MAPIGWSHLREGYREHIEGNFYPAAVTNVYASLRPGDGFYSAHDGGMIFYVPFADHMVRNGSLVVDAWVASLDGPMISLRGSRGEGSRARVHDLSFEGLVMQHTTWLAPWLKCGAYIPQQSGTWYDCDGHAPRVHGNTALGTLTPSPGALEIHASWNISISGCTFRHVGQSAIAVEDGSQSIVIRGNSFYDCSCHGIRLGQIDDYALSDAENMNAHALIEENQFLRMGVEYRDCSALFGPYFLNATISHNDIFNVSWGGIAWGWGGWNGAPVRPTLGNTRIMSNQIKYVNLVTSDGGPIYVMAPQPNSVMAYNFVGWAMHHAASLYHDEGSAFWSTHHNVVEQPSGCSAGSHCYIANNGRFDFLAAWASSEYNISISHIYTRNLTIRNVYEGNNITVDDVHVVGWEEQWLDEARAIVAQAGCTSKLSPTSWNMARQKHWGSTSLGARGNGLLFV